jgi:SM-20-related protein
MEFPVCPEAFTPAVLDSLIDNFLADGWAVADGLLPPDVVGNLAAEAIGGDALGGFHASAVGSGTSRSVVYATRQDRICWLDPLAATIAQQRGWDLLDALMSGLNRSLYLGLFDREAHFAIFAAGALYKPHLDCFQSGGLRVVSCILYLTEDWSETDGGALRLFFPGGYRDIFPQPGRLVCFLSDQFYHEVRPASRRRVSLACWFLRRSILPVKVA